MDEAPRTRSRASVQTLLAASQSPVRVSVCAICQYDVRLTFFDAQDERLSGQKDEGYGFDSLNFVSSATHLTL
jgi:hypothetical protein